tara:strand:- start:431 stop:988 length:558 start_codon:yes stop_codon:yes gene_type:complete
MSRSRQEKEKEKMRNDWIEAMRWHNREQALIPLQNIGTGEPGDQLLYRCLIVRFEDIWVKKMKSYKNSLKRNKTETHEGYTKKQLEAEIRHYEAKKEKALVELGKIVYEPVIAIINEQEEQEQQRRQGQQQGPPQGLQQQQQQQQDRDGDVVMRGTISIGGKKRRKSRRRKRTRKRRKSRRRKRR